MLRPAGLVLLSLLVAAPVFAAGKPNVIVIMSDDHGWADAGFQKLPASRDVLTPHLDRLFGSGLRFTQGYVASSTCGPSRASLLTGRTSSRFAFEDNQPGTPFEGPPPTEILIPQALKGTGYRTGAIGKWHLGEAPDRLPAARGFDEFFGFLGGGHDYFKGTLVRGTKEEPMQGYITDVLADGAADFIRRNRAQPFFLYVAFNAPHSPMQAPQRLIERIVAHQPAFRPAYERMKLKTGAGALPNFDLRPFKGKDVDREIMRLVYCAMVAGLDDGVGRILDTLESTGLREKTLVFFLADNGAALARPNDLGGVNLPLRSGKGSVFDGGLRVLFGASWPGTLPPGRDYDGVLNAVDIFTTTVTLAGGHIPRDRPVDGVDLLPYLTGKKTGHPHDTFFFRRHDRKMWSLRDGDFKWVVSPKDGLAGEGALYRISHDSAESRDVSAEFPDKKRALMATYARLTADLPKPVQHSKKPDVE